MSLIVPITQHTAAQTAGAATVDPLDAIRNEVGAPVENPGAALDRDAFLKLLVAQLKYQDPTNPADTSQMLSDSAQLTMVDRMNELADSFKSSLATQQLSLAGTIVGREVTFLDAEGVARTAVVETARIDGDEMHLVAGGYEVPFGSITSVSASPATTTNPITTTPTTTTPTATNPTIAGQPPAGQTGTGQTDSDQTGTGTTSTGGTTSPTSASDAGESTSGNG